MSHITLERVRRIQKSRTSPLRRASHNLTHDAPDDVPLEPDPQTAIDVGAKTNSARGTWVANNNTPRRDVAPIRRPPLTWGRPRVCLPTRPQGGPLRFNSTDTNFTLISSPTFFSARPTYSPSPRVCCRQINTWLVRVCDYDLKHSASRSSLSSCPLVPEPPQVNS